MTESPQPVHKGSNTTAIVLFVGLAVVGICIVLAICIGPFAFFAWITDRQMDRMDEHGPQMQRLAEYFLR
jgi:hypothetical protein